MRKPEAPAANETARAVAAIWRIESVKVVAHVARITRDLGLAEDCAQDALVAALEHWPELGIPERPGAWLMTAAKRRALDHLRHRTLAAAQHERLGHEADLQQQIAAREFGEMLDARLDDAIGDEILALIFATCHPLLAPEARAVLTLKVVGGLSIPEIARAYLKPEPTIAQRIVRAKRALAAAHVPFEVPCGRELAPRLASVLEVLYLMFNEGYAASAGPEWMRPALCEEALRLARALAARLPGESEVHGLQALMELQASRLAARADARGDPILLADQDRGRWDRLLIRRGLSALDRAHSSGALGPYALQAAIAACHARAADFAGNARERALLQARARKCRAAGASAVPVAPPGR